jgi:hypothetical protein
MLLGRLKPIMTVKPEACIGGNATDETAIKAGFAIEGASWIAICCMRQSSGDEGSEGVPLHLLDGVQQALWPIWAHMKNCAHERQPPHNIVAVSRNAIPRIAIFFSTLSLAV